MIRSVQPLLPELKAGLAAIYGDRLSGVYLFGSYARGEEDRESDVDVLVLLDEIRHYAEEVDRTGALGSRLSLKYGVSISQVFMRESDWRRGETPFLANVREEAVTV